MNTSTRKEIHSWIDAQGFRANVGILLSNRHDQLFWGKRVGMDAWQFPQGGILHDEPVERAMYRELEEETGLRPHQVEVIGCTRGWLRYRLPKRLIRWKSKPVCIGQKQIWYLLRLVANDSEVDVGATANPEFDSWRWVEFWDPVTEVVAFKRYVYKQALTELAPLLFD